MSQQPSRARSSRLTSPWQPLTVSILAFALPAGGAVLTVRNLERLQELTPNAARKLLYLIVCLFAFGLGILVLVSQKDQSGRFAIDSGTLLILSLGVAVASYLAQRPGFRTWRSRHPSERTGSVLEAIGLTVIYYLITALVAVPLILVAASISGGNLGLSTP